MLTDFIFSDEEAFELKTRNQFYNKLTDSECSLDDYRHATNVWCHLFLSNYAKDGCIAISRCISKAYVWELTNLTLAYNAPTGFIVHVQIDTFKTNIKICLFWQKKNKVS